MRYRLVPARRSAVATARRRGEFALGGLCLPYGRQGEERDERVEGADIRLNDQYGFEHPNGFSSLFGRKKGQP